jgi:hypothetical protein
MAWTAYFDAIHQEMMALMTEPGWATQTTITSRLTTIRNELLGIKTSLKGTDSELETLLTQLEAARVAAVAANEGRYELLIGSEAEVMSYPELADHMLTIHYASVGTGYETLITEQDSRDTAIAELFNDASDDIEEWHDEYDTSETWSTLATDQGTRDSTAAGEFLTAWALLEELFDDLGEQAKADVGDTYRARRAELVQSMSDRGIYGTSVAASLELGIASAEASEGRRIDEAITAAKIQAYQPFLMAMSQSKQQGSQNQLAIAMQSAGTAEERTARLVESLKQMLLGQIQTKQNASQNQLAIGSEQLKAIMEIAGRMERLYQLAPAVVQSREDVAPNLDTIVNVTAMLGKGAAAKTSIPQMQSLMSLVQAEAR